MNALLILIPVSLLLIVAAVVIFFWGIRHDQFDDLDTPKILPLLDSDEEPPADDQPTADADHQETGRADQGRRPDPP